MHARLRQTQTASCPAGPFRRGRTVEGHRVVDFGRAEVEQVGDLADRFERHAAQLVLDDVQRRQRHRLLARIARQVRQDLLPQRLFASSAHAHRSNSAAMMFRLPSTATTSLT